MCARAGYPKRASTSRFLGPSGIDSAIDCKIEGDHETVQSGISFCPHPPPTSSFFSLFCPCFGGIRYPPTTTTSSFFSHFCPCFGSARVSDR